MFSATIGQRLKLARQQMGLSTRAAAEIVSRAAPVSHATLANYENGKTQPDMAILAVLSRCYEVDLNWFFSKPSSFSGLRYRRLKSRVPIQQKERFEALSQRWLSAYRSLERHLEKPLKGHIELGKFRGANPTEAANVLRRDLKLDSDGTDPPPVSSVVQVIRLCGIRLIELDAVDGIDGLAARLDHEPTIIINGNVSNDRYRMDMAHELGHHLLGHCDEVSKLNDELADEEAYEFAMSLLLPDVQLRKALKGFSMVRLFEYKLRFGISLSSMIFQGQKRGLIPESLARRVWIEFAKRGYKKKEPGEVPSDRPTRFEQLIEFAVMKGSGYDEISRVTGIPQRDLKDRVSYVLRQMGVSSGGGEENLAVEPPRMRIVR